LDAVDAADHGNRRTTEVEQLNSPKSLKTVKFSDQYRHFNRKATDKTIWNGTESRMGLIKRGKNRGT